MKLFVGRKQELKQMKELRESFRQKGLANLVVIKGRRRVGKSRLAEEYAKNKRFLSFTGIAPTETMTAQDQRARFSVQLSQYFSLPLLDFQNWSLALDHLAHYLTEEPTVILFDEISWMGSKDSTFIPKLKAWWDESLQNHENLTVIFCSSISTWIEENILKSTSFFGRISLVIDLQPLTLPECAKFLSVTGFKGGAYEMYKVLSVVGGIPWYLEQVSGSDMADETIKRLCFSRNGILTTEFNNIFYDLFHKKGSVYKNIIYQLASGMKTLGDLRKAVGYAASGVFSQIVENLITAGFVTSHYQWSLKSVHVSKISLYRLSDPYLRFYIKYIEPNLQKINQKSFQDMSIAQLSGWDTMMGFQVESLLLQNRPLLLKALGVFPTDIVGDNPYLQKGTTRYKGCQIDYLVQTNAKNLIACECKFKRSELGLEIVDSVRDKLKRFSVPRGFGIAPVLFHLGGVSMQVYDAQYFFRIIDIAGFLDESLE